MFLKHYFHRSAPVYSLTQAQAHAGREIASLSYSLTHQLQAHAGREIASLSYSLTLAQAHAGREIASLSTPEGDPTRKLKTNLDLIRPACKLPFRGSRGSGLGLDFIIIFDL